MRQQLLGLYGAISAIAFVTASEAVAQTALSGTSANTQGAAAFDATSTAIGQNAGAGNLSASGDTAVGHMAGAYGNQASKRAVMDKAGIVLADQQSGQRATDHGHQGIDRHQP